MNDNNKNVSTNTDKAENDDSVEVVDSKKTKYSFGELLKNPILGALIGIGVSFIIFFISAYKMEPCYSFSESEVLIEKKTELDEIGITYKGIKVENLFKSKVLIWNQGKKPIDKTTISKDKPIQIEIPENIDLLQYSATKTSRPDLQVNCILNEKKEGKFIEIEIHGDEALEIDDGCLIELIYSGDNEPNFNVVGRIKGVKDGLSEKKWDSVVKRKNLDDWVRLLPMYFWFMIGAFMYYTEIVRFRRKEKNNILLGSVLFFPAVITTISFTWPLLFGLDWVL